ncbi:hypothetical protein B0H17DRAFT_1221961 [Mycena rosella]|uniref:Uncharacterized protein n=1 Tax=Mycena rosella TaxID=1033263 RepID=A0AAD7AZY6_MYCRO|nr:hypothetical protein B0H17DRAFT_1221961 [Mycena rosella]
MSHAMDCAIRVSDATPSLGTSKSSAPALAKHEAAVKLGGLNKYCQQLNLLLLEMRTIRKSTCASGSAPPSDVAVTMCDASALEPAVFLSPTPVLAVELGGLKDLHRKLTTPDSEPRTSNKGSSTSSGEDPSVPVLSVLFSPLMSSARALVVAGLAVELGGHMSVFTGEIATIEPGGLKALAQQLLYKLEVHTEEAASVASQQTRSSQSPSSAHTRLSDVESGGLKDSHQQYSAPNREIRTSGKSMRASSAATPSDVAVARCDASALEPVVSPSPTPAMAIKLGGLLPPQNKRLAIVQTVSKLTANVCASFVSKSTSPLVIHSTLATRIFALVSAITWTLYLSYLGYSLVGNSAPYTEWEREGISTRTGFIWIGTGTR